MRRRDLLKYLLSTPLAATVDLEKLLWVPEKTIFIPTDRQVAFFGGGAGGGKSWALYGIPYHVTDGTTARWLGFERQDAPDNSTTESGQAGS